MLKKFDKAYGIYHWDTFDDETILIAEADTRNEAWKYIQDNYKGRLSAQGADRVEIVDRLGNVVESYSTK